MNVTIKKAAIKDGNFLSVEYTEQQPDGFSTIKKDCKIPVHADLKQAFRKLDVHLASLGFQFDKNGEVPVSKITCKGFTIGGSGDNEGVTLSGVYVLPNDKTLNITSPFQRFADDFYEYEHMDELMEVLNECENEVHEYLFNGKHEEDNQLALFPELEEAE